jgi:hypothetical protein
MITFRSRCATARAIDSAGFLSPSPTACLSRQRSHLKPSGIHYPRRIDYAAGLSMFLGMGQRTRVLPFPGTRVRLHRRLGVFFDVAVRSDATFLNFILTNGGTKNCPNDMRLRLQSARCRR